MKRLMFAMVAVALATVANAEQSLAYGYVAKAGFDPGLSAERASWYSCYAMTQKQAQGLLGTTETVTYQTVAAWLGLNMYDETSYAKTVAALQAVSEQVPNAGIYQSRLYQFGTETGSAVDSTGAIGVFLAYNGRYDAGYRVMAQDTAETRAGKFYFDEDTSAKTASWATVSVPEPTSGLLLLLGVAGLALKRKQK